MTEWRCIPSWPEYEVSDDGKVRHGARLLRLQRGKAHGYMYFQPTRAKTVLVHRAILEAFVRPGQPGEEARHVGGGKTANWLTNLAWGTRQDNADDAVRLGEIRYGEDHCRARLTARRVRDMRQRWEAGETIAAIARDEGVAYNTAEMALKRRTWRRVR